MKSLNAFILSLRTFSAYASTKPQDQKDVLDISFDGRRISLVNDNGHCALARSDDSLLRLDVNWPCQFSQTFLTKAVLENYRSATIFMVQHSNRVVPPDTHCTTDLQAIRYFKGNVELAPVHKVERCSIRRWDQKIFVGQFDW
ncbi:hypothetical protein [Pseudomonas sp. NPDC088444]|uniref:hypothetical protein n=1 Tax=Pseudomonas sp. NPDC088444 TaxID=3364456 RepID=UPI00384FA573